MASNDGRGRVRSAVEATPARTQRVKVRATRTGFNENQRYRENDVFLYTPPDNETALPTWMQRVASSTPERVTTGQAEINAALEVVRQERAGGSDEVI
jgi:hypothetical protein